jgi:hypothetical protein
MCLMVYFGGGSVAYSDRPLLIFLDALRGHTIDDRITTRIHVPHEHTEADHNQDEKNDNERDHGKGLVKVGAVLVSQLDRSFGVRTLRSD